MQTTPEHLLTGFSPAKINLFLHITGRRPDGYHLLQSLFCPITLGDQVELRLSTTDHEQLEIDREGDLVHLPEEIDLTVRACRAFYRHAGLGQAFKVKIRVRKTIPEQAGLGGGSSNAATVLRLLQQHHDHPLARARLAEIALSLGADVPFFLQDSCAFVEGIGETITPIQGVDGHLLVYKPPVSCPTSEIFSDPQLARNSSDVKIAVFDSVSRTDRGLMSFIKAHTQNALQAVVSCKYPEWDATYSVFSSCVAGSSPQLVRMSGSGSAMFAVFASPSQLSSAVAAVADAPELKAGQWFECRIGLNAN